MLKKKIWVALLTAVLLLGAPALAAMSGEQFIDLCVNGSAVQVKQALDAGVRPNAHDSQGMTALMSAASFNRRDIAGLLLDRGADLEARDMFGFTALIHTAQATPEPETISFLLQRGAKVNAKSNTGLTALMVAANNDHTDPKVVSLLLAAGADVNAADNDGFTPLIWAAISSTPDMVSALLKAGADPRARERLHGTTAADCAADNKAFQGLAGSMVLQSLREHAQ